MYVDYSLNNRTIFSPISDRPFDDYASQHIPDDIPTLLRFVERLWLLSDVVRAALSRVVRHFVTDIDIAMVSAADKKNWRKYLIETVDVLAQLVELGDDYVCYGNSFSTCVQTFDRYLVCPSCAQIADSEQADVAHRRGAFVVKLSAVFEHAAAFKYQWRDFSFILTCPVCKYRGPFVRYDQLRKNALQVLRLSPHEMTIRARPFGPDEYVWRLPQDYRTQLTAGTEEYLLHTPWEIVETVKAKKDFLFNTGAVFHMREPTLAGIRAKGWGIPRLLSVAHRLIHVQLLMRHTEALCSDYLVPIRVITPATASLGGGEPLIKTISMPGFTASVNSIINKHREDPTRWHVLPFPVDTSIIGANADLSAPTQLLELNLAKVLDGLNVPAELYKMSLSYQALPQAIRLFERCWMSVPAQLNNWLQWFTDTVANLFAWKRPSVLLQPVTMADDIERRNVLLQLSAANAISQSTALSRWGIDPEQEVDKIIGEQRDRQRKEQAFAEEQQRAVSLTQPQPVGGPVTSATPAPATPGDLVSEATQIAQTLLNADTRTVRQTLDSLDHSNKPLAALTRDTLRELRQQRAVMAANMG